MSPQSIDPRLSMKRFLPSARADDIARSFPRIDTVLPGQVFGAYLELAQVACTTLPFSGFFLRAGHDLEAWSDVDLACLSDSNLEKCVTHSQMMAYGRLREDTYNQIADYDPTWGSVSPDGVPTRGLALIPGAEIMVQDSSDPYYETPDDIFHSNALYWHEFESAHERLEAARARRASFALFSALTGFHGYDAAELSYRSPLP